LFLRQHWKCRPERSDGAARALIIVRREPSAERANPAFADAVDSGDADRGGGFDSDRLCCGLWCIPLSSEDEPRLRTGYGHHLRCSAGEKWQDGISFRSAAGADLCELVVSARGILALLVFAASHRTADEYLRKKDRKTERKTKRIAKADTFSTLSRHECTPCPSQNSFSGDS